jgi:hypothetical protein
VPVSPSANAPHRFTSAGAAPGKNVLRIDLNIREILPDESWAGSRQPSDNDAIGRLAATGLAKPFYEVFKLVFSFYAPDLPACLHRSLRWRYAYQFAGAETTIN